MKINERFVLRQVADAWVVIPLSSSAVDFDGMITMNESGAFLWRQLEQGSTRENLVDALTGEYNVSREEALADIDAFLASLNKVGCVEES